VKPLTSIFRLCHSGVGLGMLVGAKTNGFDLSSCCAHAGACSLAEAGDQT
jgi:hypothetical protein